MQETKKKKVGSRLFNGEWELSGYFRAELWGLGAEKLRKTANLNVHNISYSENFPL